MNEVRDFLEEYAGKSTLVDYDRYSKEIVETYENAYNEIYTKLDKDAKKIPYMTAKAQAEILKNVGDSLDKFEKKATSKLKKAIELVAKKEAEKAFKHMEAFSKTKKLEIPIKFNEQLVQTTIADTMEHIAGQTDRILSATKQKLREISRETFKKASVEGLSYKEAYEELLKEQKELIPEFKFIDRLGRGWATTTYFDMLVKTVMANIARETYINTLLVNGQDLVKISSHGATDPCSRWEGQVISLTGKVKGYPTLSDVRATGEIFHPRCKHRLLPYNERMENIYKLADIVIEEGKLDDLFNVLEKNPDIDVLDLLGNIAVLQDLAKSVLGNKADDIVDKLPIFNNVKDVENYIIEQGWADKVNLKDLPTEFQAEFIKVLSEVTEDFDLKLKEIWATNGKLKKKDVYASLSVDVDTGEQSFVINTNIIKNKGSLDEFNKMIYEDYKEGWTISENFNDVLLHELGHSIFYKDAKQYDLLTLQQEYGYKTGMAQKMGFKSKYGNMNGIEGFAEGFVYYYKNGKKYTNDVMEEFMGEFVNKAKKK